MLEGSRVDNRWETIMNEKIRKICGHAGWFALGGLVLVCFSILQKRLIMGVSHLVFVPKGYVLPPEE
jgi:hypothetical protein